MRNGFHSRNLRCAVARKGIRGHCRQPSGCVLGLAMQVRELVESAYDRASAILKANEKQLHTLASELLDKESLTGKEVRCWCC